MSNTSNTQQAFWVGIGSLFSFAFGIVSAMILSRYFDKADYGTYRQVLYVYNTLLTVFTLGLPKAYSYFLPRVPLNEAKSLIKKITKLFYLLGGIFSLLLFVFSAQIALFLKNPDLSLALKIFSPVPLFMLPTMGVESILATYRKTQFITIYNVVTRIFMLLCVVLPVLFFKGTYIHAIIGFVIASALTYIIAEYLKFLPVRKEGNDKTELSYRSIFEFSLPLLYASLWGILMNSSDQFFVSRYFGNVTFAEFSNGAMELPFVGMVIGATSTVLSPVFSRMSHEKVNPKEEIYPLWRNVFEKSILLIYPILVYCWMFADLIMVVLYGHQYENSSIYFRIKLLINFFTLIAYAPLIVNIGKVKFYANAIMIGAISQILLQYLSVKTINTPVAVIVISTICNMGIIFSMLAFVAKYFRTKLYKLFPIKLIATIIIPTFVLSLVLRFIFYQVLEINPIVVLTITLFIYLLIYALYSYVVKLNYISIIKSLKNK